jgi:hypothetical protein
MFSLNSPFSQASNTVLFLQRFKPTEAYTCAESMFDLPFHRNTFDGIIYFGLATSFDQKHARLLLCDAHRVVKSNRTAHFL